MRPHAIVGIAALVLAVTAPTAAQTSSWDFAAKPSSTVSKAAPAAPSITPKERPSPPRSTPVAPRRSARGREHVASPTPERAVRLQWEPPAPRARVSLDWSGAGRPLLVSAPATSAAVPATMTAPSSFESAPAAVPAPAAAMSMGIAQTEPIAGPGASAASPPDMLIARSGSGWPKAIMVGVQYRGRLEDASGSPAAARRDDAYYLNRVRLDATITAAPWLKAFVQVQDAQAMRYDQASQPASLANTVDLREGYVEARMPGASTFGLRAGRQGLAFGDQRLVGDADWLNTARSFDAVRVFAARPGVQIDAFASSVVLVDQRGVDRHAPGESFWGAYLSLSRLVPHGVVEPFVFVKREDSVQGESGSNGNGVTYTYGARAAGAMARGFDYRVEVAAQRGELAGDAVETVAGNYALGWTVRPTGIAPRLVAEFSHASGDGHPLDGRRQTFDQLYPTAHAKYGIADQMGWRNLRHARLGMEFLPSRQSKVNVDAHRLYLATTADGFYGAGGVLELLNRAATSRSVGTELDVQATYAVSKALTIGAGVGTLFAGGYLVQSGAAGTVWTPYLMWDVKF